MHEVEVTRTISAEPDAVWSTIARGDGVHRWFPEAIVACSLDGDGVGATRRCTMADGAELEERILEVDHAARRLRYGVDRHPLPARGVEATVEVRPAEAGTGSEVTWTTTFDAEDGAADAVRSMLADLYARGIESLGRHAAAARGSS